MKGKIVPAIMLTLLLTSMLTLAFNIQLVKADPKTWYVDDDGGADFTEIQDAIYAASPGDTIYVYNGTYSEHIYIYNSLTLIGENKYGTIIDGSGYGVYFRWYGAVVTITGPRVNFTNFTVRNAGWADLSGIAVYLDDASFCSINDLVTSDSRFGIAPLFYSRDNIISNNTISDAEIGIVNFNPWPSYNNMVVGNRISNSSNGIYFNYPYSVQVISNIISNNSRYPYGIHFQMGGSDNKVIGNIVENSDNAIRLDYADRNLISENIVSNNTYGLFVGYESSDNIVIGNNASDSTIGIMIWDNSNNNTVINNEASNNYYGMGVSSSNQNKIYHNNFLGNTYQVLSIGDSANVWDDGYPSGGNYWSDYGGVDADGDGIGDTPYVIDTDNTDNYPLVSPWWAHTIGFALSKTIVGEGYNVTLNVTVKNEGSSIETFNLTVYANTTAIATVTNVTLLPGDSLLVNFTWDTTGFEKGNYTITASITPFSAQTTGGWILVTIPGDVDGDLVDGHYDVFLYDAVKLLACYGSKEGDSNFDPNCDIDDSGQVFLFDAVILLSRYGQKYP